MFSISISKNPTLVSLSPGRCLPEVLQNIKHKPHETHIRPGSKGLTCPIKLIEFAGCCSFQTFEMYKSCWNREIQAVGGWDGKTGSLSFMHSADTFAGSELVIQELEHQKRRKNGPYSMVQWVCNLSYRSFMALSSCASQPRRLLCTMKLQP